MLTLALIACGTPPPDPPSWSFEGASPAQCEPPLEPPAWSPPATADAAVRWIDTAIRARPGTDLEIPFELTPPAPVPMEVAVPHPPPGVSVEPAVLVEGETSGHLRVTIEPHATVGPRALDALALTAGTAEVGVEPGLTLWVHGTPGTPDESFAHCQDQSAFEHCRGLEIPAELGVDQPVTAVHVSSEGSITVAYDGYAEWNLVRLLRDGSTDAGFGGSGTATVQWPGEPGFRSQGRLLEVPGGDYVVFAQSDGFAPAVHSAMAYVDAAGGRGTDFGRDGVVWVEADDSATDGCHIATCHTTGPKLFRMDGEAVAWPAWDEPMTCDRVAFDGAGRVVVAGAALDAPGFRVVRLQPDGQPDPTFANEGRWHGDRTGMTGGVVTSLVSVPSGGFAALGVYDGTSRAVVLRVDGTGAPPADWTGPSVLPSTTPERPWDARDLLDIVVDDAGQVVVYTRRALIRLATSGDLDRDFAVDGTVDLQPERWGQGPTPTPWGRLAYDSDGRRYVLAFGAWYGPAHVRRYWQ